MNDPTLVIYRSSDDSTPITVIKENPPMKKLRDDSTVLAIEE